MRTLLGWIGALGFFLVTGSVAWSVDKTFMLQRVDAFADNNFDIQLTVSSQVQGILPPVVDTFPANGDDLEYGATQAEFEIEELFSRATAIGEGWIDTAIGNWTAVGQADVTADVDLKRDDDIFNWLGSPSWGASIIADSHFIVETDEEYDPQFELTLRGFFFVVATGYTIDPPTGFAPAIGTTIVTQVITPQDSRICTATYDGTSWYWAVTDQNQNVIEDGGGSGINELIDFELPVFQGQLIEVRTSIVGGTAAPQWNCDCEDSWAMVASAWFDVVDP